MKTITIMGIILVVFGFLGFVFKRVSLTAIKQVADLGLLELKKM